MDAIEQKDADLSNDETPELTETDDTPEAPKEEPKEKKEYTTGEKLARVTRLKQRYEKELGIEPTVIKVESAPESKGTPGELDETQLDYLDLKGISDSDEIDIIQKVIAKTGQTVRQALKDDYVVAKLEKLRADRAVKDATPSSTKRGGNQTTDIAAAVARFEQTGALPDDFETRSAIVNAIEAKTSHNVPRWKK